MPSGRANHKGTSDKPNVNASGQVNMNAASDKSVDPEDVLLEGAMTNTTRTQESVDFPPATQGPGEEEEDSSEVVE